MTMCIKKRIGHYRTVMGLQRKLFSHLTNIVQVAIMNVIKKFISYLIGLLLRRQAKPDFTN